MLQTPAQFSNFHSEKTSTTLSTEPKSCSHPLCSVPSTWEKMFSPPAEISRARIQLFHHGPSQKSLIKLENQWEFSSSGGASGRSTMTQDGQSRDVPMELHTHNPGTGIPAAPSLQYKPLINQTPRGGCRACGRQRNQKKSFNSSPRSPK